MLYGVVPQNPTANTSMKLCEAIHVNISGVIELLREKYKYSKCMKNFIYIYSKYVCYFRYVRYHETEQWTFGEGK